MSDPPSTQEPKTAKNTEFKKPVLFGRIGKLPKKVKNEPDKVHEEVPSDKQAKSEETSSESNSNSSATPQVSVKDVSTPVPYKEPKWSGMCPDGSEYALEVLKSGMIVERVDLTVQPYYVFGRLPNCDVVMAHPTISRHHCILQYKAFASDDEPASGWYLYELGSTHGTFLNKEKLKPAHYTRLRVGHQIKFGNSTRTYILVGPSFDCEGESELTVTEIKQKALQMKLERDRMIQEAKEQREIAKLEEEKRREEQGIDWGMGEDAENETDLSENPFAVTTNEELYLTDPKKTLRGFFEREGHELKYDCEERGTGQHLCKVELPIDDARGRAVVAEVIHTGKKKEAVIACAMEACRILDRAGLLRVAKAESRRRKERDWSADDFYDSDDDNYLDRTGHVENKRRHRMQKHGAAPAVDVPLTFEQLLKQETELESKISIEEKNLERLRTSHKTNRQTSDADDLDQYMASLSAPSMSVKAEISTSKMTIQKLKGELSKTHRLAELARPAHLPPLIKKDDKIIKINNSVVYGKRIKLKSDTEKKPAPKIKKEEEEFVEEVDSDEEPSRSTQNETEVSTKTEAETTQSTTETSKSTQIEAKVEQIKTEGDHLNEENDKNPSKPDKSKNDSKETQDTVKVNSEEDSKRTFGPMRPPDNYVIPEDYFGKRDLPEIMEDD